MAKTRECYESHTGNCYCAAGRRESNAELARLRESNERLLGALRVISGLSSRHDARIIANDAIAAAEGEK